MKDVYINTFPGKLEEKKYKFAVFIAYFIMAAGDLYINEGGLRNYAYIYSANFVVYVIINDFNISRCLPQFQWVRLNSFTAANGGRNVQRVVIMLTDGKNNGGLNPQSEASALKAKPPNGVTVVTIGVGSNFNANQLKQIATKESFFFETSQFSQLSTLLDGVVNTICTCKYHNNI